MKQIEERLDLSCLTVTGKTLGENLVGAEVYNDDVIRPLSNPLFGEGSLAVLRGNLCPDGAVIKPAACDPKLYHAQHRDGRAQRRPRRHRWVDPCHAPSGARLRRCGVGCGLSGRARDWPTRHAGLLRQPFGPTNLTLHEALDINVPIPKTGSVLCGWLRLRKG